MNTVTSQWEIDIRNKALQEGRQEEREKLHSVIRSLKHKGFKISYISEITGLSIEEILSMDL